MMNKDLKIVVVCGGISSERDISLRSGKKIYEALQRKGYAHTQLYDLTRDNMTGILQCQPDIVFLGLHGKGGEDGTIQGMLEFAGIPYTGSGVTASALCMDKVLTKHVLANVGLPTPRFISLKKYDFADNKEIARHLLKEMQLPMVLKSPCQGSSIGTNIIKEESQIEAGIDDVFKYGDTLLAEDFISGVEITMPILGNQQLTVLPLIEISYEREFNDYTTKYTSGMHQHIIPACIDKHTEKDIIALGEKAYKVLGCCGLARVDFIADPVKGPMIIEVNTLPGMTDVSLFPDAANYAGISYEDLVERILLLGLETNRDINI